MKGVFNDVDGDQHVAVTLDDDPAADMLEWQGRFLYFHPDEIEVRRRERCSSPASATSSSATTASASRSSSTST